MKKMLVILVVTVLASLPLFGQGTTAGKISVGAGAEVGIPIGDFSNASSFGIGGLAVGSYDIDENLAVNLMAGYLSFSGKDVAGVTGPTWGIIPILAGVKYFFTPPMQETSMRLYGAADAGLYMTKFDAPGVTILGVTVGGGTVSNTDFGVSPILGSRFKAGDNLDVDVHANYTMIFTSGSTTSWVGAGIGLVFGL